MQQPVLSTPKKGSFQNRPIKQADVRKFEPRRASSAILSVERPRSNQEVSSDLATYRSLKVTTPINEEATTPRKSSENDLLNNSGELTHKSPLPFRVATLVKNSSGIQLTYRGAGVLPNLIKPEGEVANKQSLPLAKSSSTWHIKPVSQSRNLLNL